MAKVATVDRRTTVVYRKGAGRFHYSVVPLTPVDCPVLPVWDWLASRAHVLFISVGGLRQTRR